MDLRELIMLIGAYILFDYMFWVSFIYFLPGVLLSYLFSVFSSIYISSDWLGTIYISPFFKLNDLIADWDWRVYVSFEFKIFKF